MKQGVHNAKAHSPLHHISLSCVLSYANIGGIPKDKAKATQIIGLGLGLGSNASRSLMHTFLAFPNLKQH